MFKENIAFVHFLPSEKANPHIGSSGVLEEVEEETVEVVVSEDLIQYVIKAMKEVHPYEEVAYYVVALEDF